MNWFGRSLSMVDNFDNPPLGSYYLAAVTALGGWSEPVLHLALLLPALVATWGTFLLARRFCSRPLLATAATVLTPVFLISSTTLMCDVLLLAFWIWSLVWFDRGLENKSPLAFVLSGALAGLAFWSKYTGLALVPLLAFWGFAHERRAGWWLLALALPLMSVGAYEWITFQLYGKGLFLSAGAVASKGSHKGSAWDGTLLGLSFLGGCCFPLLFYAPRLWSFKQTIAGLCLLAPLLFLFPYSGRFTLLWDLNGRPNWLLVLQGVLLITSGLHLFFLTAADFWEHRDPRALLLALWVAGIFVFASSMNWTVNGRSLLPVVPALGILVARRLDRQAQNRPAQNTSTVSASGVPSAPRWARTTGWATCWPLLAGAALSLFLAKTDYDLAKSGRAAAQAVCARYQVPGKTLWFEGHWGFQYYMEQNNAKALEWPFLNAAAGDYVVVPSEAVNTYDISTDLVRLIDILDYRPNRRCATMSLSAGAGFYAAVCTPFPFSFGRIDPERYYVFEVTQSLEAAAKAPGGISTVGAVTQQFARERQALAQQQSQNRSPLN